MSTKITEINKCTGTNCQFTYLDLASSPNLTKIAPTTIETGQVIVNGSNLQDNSNFVEIALTNTETGAKYVLAVNQSTPTSAVFEIPNNVESGHYVVKTRNAKGESNGMMLNVKWVAGSRSTSSLSEAGGIHTWSGGSGYPTAIGGMFKV